jgi:hypothetical protein
MTQYYFALPTLVVMLALTGCEVAPQDSSGVDSRQSLNGLAVDGRVAGGKVWVDSNDDYAVDDFEPFAYTDSNGYYSYNPINDENYCDLPEISDEYQRYCLVFGSSMDSMTIRIKGGIDLGTGEKLKGVMAMTSTFDESVVAEKPLVMSPLTTLLSAATDDTDRKEIREQMGIESDDDLRVDFSAADNVKSKRLLANAVAVQTMMDILTGSADADSTETAAQQKLIKSLSKSIATNKKPPAEFNTEMLSSLVTEVSSDATKQESVSARLLDLNKEIHKIASAGSLKEVNAQLKASEVIAQLVKKEASGSDAEAVKKILDSGIETLSIALKTTLTDDTVEFDISSITTSLVTVGKTAVTNDTNFDVTEVTTAVNNAKLSKGTVWGGRWFVLQPTGSQADDVLPGAYLAIFLAGTAESEDGKLGLCVNVKSATSSDPEDNFVNEFVGGTWIKIPTGVVLNLNYEGQLFEGKMNAKVKETSDSPQNFGFTSDVDGTTESETLLLHVNGVSALTNVTLPTSADDCANKVNKELI